MANIYSIADKFKADLIAGDKHATEQIANAYAKGFKAVKGEIDGILQQAQGRPLTKAEIHQLKRLDNLEHDLKTALNSAANNTSSIIYHRQALAINKSYEASHKMITALKPDSLPVRANISAIKAHAGLASNGSPLNDLLKAYGDESAQGIMDILLAGLATGKNPLLIAKEINAKYGTAMFRATALSRTETLRAYREGLRANYEANSDIIDKWQWLCALSARTCAACLAMDGKTFDLKTPMAAHVQCRCTMIPIVKDMPNNARQSGSDWFDNQDSNVQEQILGKSGYAKYAAGASLDSFVKEIHSATWGNSYVQAG